jgi:hypothetical protein
MRGIGGLESGNDVNVRFLDHNFVKIVFHLLPLNILKITALAFWANAEFSNCEPLKTVLV